MVIKPWLSKVTNNFGYFKDIKLYIIIWMTNGLIFWYIFPGSLKISPILISE